MSEANLNGANLRSAILRYANLIELTNSADMHGANIRDTNLTGINGKNLKGALNSCPKWVCINNSLIQQ